MKSLKVVLTLLAIVLCFDSVALSVFSQTDAKTIDPKNNSSHIIKTSQGSVEFIGLEKWTPQKIQKELGYKKPDEFLYCAQDLKNKLKFPDAAVFRYMREGGHTVIVVVEPQYSNLVQYRSFPVGSVKITEEWKILIEMVRTDDHWKRPEVWRKVIKQQDSPVDFAIAKQIILEDKTTEKRIAATLF